MKNLSKITKYPQNDGFGKYLESINKAVKLVTEDNSNENAVKEIEKIDKLRKKIRDIVSEPINYRTLKMIPSFRYLIEYISEELLPYDSDNTVGKLFDSIEKYIKETDSKQSAIAMYEIQDSLSQLRINKQYQEKDTHKKLY